jgi:acetyl esterase/lipase
LTADAAKAHEENARHPYRHQNSIETRPARLIVVALMNARSLISLMSLSLALVSSTTSSWAAVLDPVRLWAGAAPGALGQEDKDVPTLTPYLPALDKATGAAVVICPGGGYGGLAQHEGKDYALWLNELGVAGFVLKYRLGSHGYRHPVMLQDAARAVRLVRSRAGEWKIDASRVGIMGSSAGGHLASTLVTHFDLGQASAEDPIDRHSSRPDLGILCYAVISMGSNTHQGSKNNLLGANPDADLVRLLSNELQVTKDTPPCFVWHTWEDQAVKVENSMEFAAALQRHGVPFDLHIYQKGRHGIGLAGGHAWTRDCAFWLKERGFVK